MTDKALSGDAARPDQPTSKNEILKRVAVVLAK
jgi:hypothetical protein